MANGDTRVSAKSEGRFHLVAALTLAMEYHTGPSPHRKKGDTVSHWKVQDGSMVFGWHASMKDSVPFPCPMNKEQVADLIIQWLESQEYPPQPDMDGHCTKGWHLYQPNREDFSRKDFDFYTTFAVRPHWVEYHK